MKTPKITESRIDSSLLYFHGSSNGKISKFREPSPAHPLFVTADIDYANAYIYAAHVNGRAQFNEDDEPGKVYLLSLNADKINMFDALKDEDVALLERRWPKYVVDSIKTKKWSVWSILRRVAMMYRIFNRECDCDASLFTEWLEAKINSGMLDEEMSIESLVDCICIMDASMGPGDDLLCAVIPREEDGPEENPDAQEWRVLGVLSELFNKTLVKLGFNAFRNVESAAGVKTDTAIGLFSPECVNSLTPTPLPELLVKDVIEELSKAGKFRDRTSSNDKIKMVLAKTKTESAKAEAV